MKTRLRLLFSSLSLLIFASCEKVVNVDLKDSDQKLIVEGEITDSPGLLTHSVLLSKTVKFSSSNQRNPVVGAFISITDATLGYTDTLNEMSPGTYTTSNILGVPGHTYILQVNAEGKSYSATSTMPPVVKLDSLYVQDFSFFGSTIKQLIPVYQDPPGVKNYYWITAQVGDSALEYQEAWDDQISDGKVNSRPFNIFDEELFKGNDTVLFTFKCIDKGSFDFYNTLENAGGQGQTPANPTSNISGNALGYFGTFSVQRRKIIVP